MADFVVEFASSDLNAKLKFGEVQTVGVGGELYEGDYTVIPKVEQQTIPTKGKLLVKDVTVRSIPFYKVSNTSGGNTVYIAKEM